jgi:hypothetical protein
VRFGGIPEFDYERMPLEHLLHETSLDAFASPVNQTYLS